MIRLRFIFDFIPREWIILITYVCDNLPAPAPLEKAVCVLCFACPWWRQVSPLGRSSSGLQKTQALVHFSLFASSGTSGSPSVVCACTARRLCRLFTAKSLPLFPACLPGLVDVLRSFPVQSLLNKLCFGFQALSFPCRHPTTSFWSLISLLDLFELSHENQTK